MTDVNLNALTQSELKEQARILSIPFKGNPSASDLRDMIRAELDGEEHEPAPKATKKKAGYKTILIHENEKDTQPVFIGVNGHNYRIRRGEEVEVPESVVSVLNDARQQVMVRKRGSKDEWEWRSQLSYPFSIVG